jgi:Tfp pilus assembly protein PilF
MAVTSDISAMKKNILISIIIFSVFIGWANLSYADNSKKAEGYIRKAQTASSSDEAYDYVHRALLLYQADYENDPLNIQALLGLSKTNQMIGDRPEAKLYVLKAYNMDPSDPKLQKTMGDFYYSFQEYSTAIEYYKLALSSGYLEDYETNLQAAKCFEKLGDSHNAETYYRVTSYINPKSKAARKKINEFDSAKHKDIEKESDKLKYKYLFKDKPAQEEEKKENEIKELIESINGTL